VEVRNIGETSSHPSGGGCVCVSRGAILLDAVATEQVPTIQIYHLSSFHTLRKRAVVFAHEDDLRLYPVYYIPRCSRVGSTVPGTYLFTPLPRPFAPKHATGIGKEAGREGIIRGQLQKSGGVQKSKKCRGKSENAVFILF